jgi:putative transposase
VCARRSTILSPHVTASADALGSPGDGEHGHLARVPARSNRHARRPRAAARHRVSVAVDLVPSRPEVRLATPAAPGASSEPESGAAHDGTDQMWHIDTTVIRLLDGTRAYVHAVIDNFSRRILAWRVADTFGPGNSVAVLLEASRSATRSASAPVVLADAGVENVNAQIDELIETGVLRRLLAFTELKFSNSMIEAWWRSLKHQWLFLHSLDSVATVRRLVAFYVDEHNRVLPHSAFRGQTPDEMYFGTGQAVPADLMARAAAARRVRVKTNRSAACETCPSLNAVA